MSRRLNLDRRTLLIGGGAGVGLVIAFAAWPRRSSSVLGRRPDEQAFGNYVKIGRDGRVTVAVPQAETGQGIWTALPQVLADELGADWATVAVEPAPLAPLYANAVAAGEGWANGLGRLKAWRADHDGLLRITARSSSMRAFEAPLREAGAMARALLIAAAAARWKVDPSACDTVGGAVFHGLERIAFGALAEEAAGLSPPRSVALRSAGPRLAGQSLPRLDGPAKSDGSLRFAGDVRLPEMVFASVRLAPPGGKLTAFSRARAQGVAGVRHLEARDGWLAIAADSSWAAEQAMRAANPRFAGPGFTGPSVRPLFEQAVGSGGGERWFERGDYQSTVAGSRPLAATYWAAPTQHLALEPLTATARFVGDMLEIWAPSQAPELARVRAAEAAGLPAERVTLYPMPVGEPGGRALEADAVPIAVALARAVKRPVQVLLSAGASQNHDRLSPGALARMSALPGAGGLAAAWKMRVATADGFAGAIGRLGGSNDAPALGALGMSGAVPPYGFPHVRINSSSINLPFRTGAMRGSPEREFTFFTESFVDELARAAGFDPLSYRIALLGQAPRLARCLATAARLADWDGGGAGSSMGIAAASAFGSHIALVADAGIEGGRIAVHRLVAAVDCGRVINPRLVIQQVEGALIWALAQATVPEPAWIAGMPRARPLGALGLPGIGATPDFSIELLRSSEPPGGVSGLAVPVLAPAIANAIAAGSGKRLRSLPFDPMATR